MRLDDLPADAVGAENEREGVVEQGFAQSAVEEHVLRDAGRLRPRAHAVIHLTDPR